MLEGKRFPFIEQSSTVGVSSAMPYLPLSLTYKNRFTQVIALLDTGASVNVLPFQVGLELGAIWEEQTIPVQLSGNLAQLPARGLVLSATVGDFPPILLGFAWTKSREAPIILGHLNFFTEFDVCFYRADLAFEVSPRRKSQSL